MAAKSIPCSIAPGKSFPPQTSQTPALLGDGRVSSLALAEHFGIRHLHVLRDIRAVLGKVPPEWGQSNFGLSSYPTEQGKELPAYHLTRDAFTLLAMGYNSPRAIAWKLRYIEAFNALERLALENAQGAAARDAARLAFALRPSQKRRMSRAVRLRKLGLGIASIAKLLNVHGREASFLLKAASALGRLGGSHAALR